MDVLVHHLGSAVTGHRSLRRLFIVTIGLSFFAFALSCTLFDMSAITRIALFGVCFLQLCAVTATWISHRQFSAEVDSYLDRLEKSTLSSGLQLSEIHETLKKVRAHFKKQNDQTENLRNVLDEISAVLSEVGKSTQITLEQSEQMQSGAQSGMESVERLRDAMESMEQAGNRLEDVQTMISSIGDKTGIINEIVFKTEMLSFNASIEAQRAGVAGRGFAVVASEVRALAKSSGNAALEIGEILSLSSKRASETVSMIKAKIVGGQRAFNECSEVIDSIHRVIADIAPMISVIKTSAEMQERSVDNTKETLASMRGLEREFNGELDSLARSIVNLSNDLNEVGQCKQQIKAIVAS